MQPFDDAEIPELVRGSQRWELLAALASVLAIALLTWLVARVLARWLSGRTRFGLRGLDRLVPAVTALVATIVALLFTYATPHEPIVIGKLLELVAIIIGFWLAARVIDVVGATSKASARLRTPQRAGSFLVVARHTAKLLLALTAVGVVAVQLGAGQQLYVILAAAAAGVAFAARDPIRNAVAFAAMAVDPPFHIGDRVRISDFRSGQSSVGTLSDVSLTAITLITREQTAVVIANIMLSQLRIENLSVADRRRIELQVPAAGVETEKLRATCEAIERELRVRPGVAADPVPRVWLAGTADGLHLKVSLWLRRVADRREVQRDVLLEIQRRLAG